MITNESELHSANRAAVLGMLTRPLRSFRIAWKWKRGNHTFGATTLWLFRGDKQEALRDFTTKNPEAINANVTEEVK